MFGRSGWDRYVRLLKIDSSLSKGIHLRMNGVEKSVSYFHWCFFFLEIVTTALHLDKCFYSKR